MEPTTTLIFCCFVQNVCSDPSRFSATSTVRFVARCFIPLAHRGGNTSYSSESTTNKLLGPKKKNNKKKKNAKAKTNGDNSKDHDNDKDSHSEFGDAESVVEDSSKSPVVGVTPVQFIQINTTDASSDHANSTRRLRLISKRMRNHKPMAISKKPRVTGILLPPQHSLSLKKRGSQT